MIFSRAELIHKSYSNVVSTNSDGEAFDVNGNLVEIDENRISNKLNELQNAEPMRLLRQERNWKLSETDWWCASDQTPTKAQLDYRKSLRDLPSSASPSLDKNGNLTGVTWPNKPE